jgi:IMP dehydrogenase
VIDSADGDSYYSYQTLELIKENFPDLDVVVGNVSEGASAGELAAAGADGIKIGQGPGSDVPLELKRVSARLR